MVKCNVSVIVDVEVAHSIVSLLEEFECDPLSKFYVVKTDTFCMIQEMDGCDIHTVSFKTKDSEYHYELSELLSEATIDDSYGTAAILFERLGYFLQAAYAITDLSQLAIFSCDTLAEAEVVADSVVVECGGYAYVTPSFNHKKQTYYILDLNGNKYNSIKLNSFLNEFGISTAYFSRDTLLENGCAYSNNVTSPIAYIIDDKFDNDRFEFIEEYSEGNYRLDFDSFEVVLLDYHESLVNSNLKLI